MTNKELEQKIKELENQLTELKNAKVEDKVWKPENEEKYWFVLYDGDVYWDWWRDDDYDIFQYEQGNCFKTKEEAEEHLKKLTIQGKFKTYVREHSDKLDWENEKQDKWYVYYISKTGEFYYGTYSLTTDAFGCYASSEQILRDAIESIGGEEVAKKYLFD